MASNFLQVKSSLYGLENNKNLNLYHSLILKLFYCSLVCYQIIQRVTFKHLWWARWLKDLSYEQGIFKRAKCGTANTYTVITYIIKNNPNQTWIMEIHSNEIKGIYNALSFTVLE